MEIGERIKQLREKCGFTQNGLAERSGVSQSHLRRVELGQQDITIGHLRLLCDALGTTLKDFFAVVDEEDDLATALAVLSPKQKALLLRFLKSL